MKVYVLMYVEDYDDFGPVGVYASEAEAIKESDALNEKIGGRRRGSGHWVVERELITAQPQPPSVSL